MTLKSKNRKTPIIYESYVYIDDMLALYISNNAIYVTMFYPENTILFP